MLEKYEKILRGITGRLEIEMLRYFVERGLLPGDAGFSSLRDALLASRLMQADVVLCALRLNTSASLRLAERLVGRPITRCPPMLMRWTSPVKHSRREGDDRRVTRVRRPEAAEKGRRRLLGCSLYDRISRARVGMDVHTLLARGLRRRDIRIALRRGYLRIA